MLFLNGVHDCKNYENKYSTGHCTGEVNHYVDRTSASAVGEKLMHFICCGVEKTEGQCCEKSCSGLFKIKC